MKDDPVGRVDSKTEIAVGQEKIDIDSGRLELDECVENYLVDTATEKLRQRFRILLRMVVWLPIEDGAHSFVIESQTESVLCSERRDPNFSIRRV